MKKKNLLEEMCALGSIMKEEILEERKSQPNKFISIEEAIKGDEENLCLGLLAQNLENMGIVTEIEKDPIINNKKINFSDIILQFIMNGMIQKKKFDLHFCFGEKRDNELLNNKNEQEKLNNKLKTKLSIKLNISEDDIILTNPQKGSYRI